MGSKVSPSDANILMDSFEEHFIYSYDMQRIIYLRYIGDIVLLWDHNEVSFLDFFNHVNSCHHSIYVYL